MPEHLAQLLSSEARERLGAALDILCTLADAGTAARLAECFNQANAGPSGHEPERINRVLSVIDARFAEPLRLWNSVRPLTCRNAAYALLCLTYR